MEEFETVKLGCGHSLQRKRTTSTQLQVRCPVCGKWTQFVAVVVQPRPSSYQLPVRQSPLRLRVG